MTDHTVASFDDELSVLAAKIAEMGGIAEQHVADSVGALDPARRDPVAADHRRRSERIDKLQRQVEEAAILMIAKRQPMAHDLREIMAAIHIATDLERVGDLAKNTAKRVIALAGNFTAQRLVAGVEHMSELTLVQLKTVLDAYADRDLAAAHEVWERDDEIDAMYTSLFRELLTYMMEDPRNDHVLHASPLLRQESRAHRRPCHQHRRDGALPDHRRAARRRTSEEGHDEHDQRRIRREMSVTLVEANAAEVAGR